MLSHPGVHKVPSLYSPKKKREKRRNGLVYHNGTRATGTRKKNSNRPNKMNRNMIIKPFPLSPRGYRQERSVSIIHPSKKSIGNKPVHLTRHPPEILN
jgi:hypothetical protein